MLDTENLMNFEIPRQDNAIIKVMGVGGGGCNAVNRMYEQGIKNVSFVVCNTDLQDLEKSPVPVKIQIGVTLTEGLGAGSNAKLGKEAAVENLNDIEKVLQDNTKMLFITAGMGGGTGTGATPIIAKLAREMGILTVAVVTIPFKSENIIRINQAIDGIAELKKHVDSLLVINNERLREIYGNLPVSQAFSKADEILAIAVKGIAEIITVPGHINVDFADVKTVMSNSGVALMSAAGAEGENRAVKAISQALDSPLLNNNDIRGAKNILLNIISGTENEITMDEVGQITNYILKAAGNASNIIWGIGSDEKLKNKINITIIATGFDTSSIPELYIREHKPKVISISKITEIEEPENSDEKIIPSQKTINFNTNIEKEQTRKKLYKEFYCETNTVQSKSKIEKTNIINPGTEKIKSIPVKIDLQKLKKLSYITNYKNIEEIENIPSYKRKGIKIEDYNTKPENEKEISKYTISDEEDKKPKLKENNPYLHDRVD